MNIIWVAVLFLYSFYGWASDIYYHFQHLCSYDFIIILWERNKVGVISNVTSSDFFFFAPLPRLCLSLNFIFENLTRNILSTYTKFFTPRFEKKKLWVPRLFLSSFQKLNGLPKQVKKNCETFLLALVVSVTCNYFSVKEIFVIFNVGLVI